MNRQTEFGFSQGFYIKHSEKYRNNLAEKTRRLRISCECVKVVWGSFIQTHFVMYFRFSLAFIIPAWTSYHTILQKKIKMLQMSVRFNALLIMSVYSTPS